MDKKRFHRLKIFEFLNSFHDNNEHSTVTSTKLKRAQQVFSSVAEKNVVDSHGSVNSSSSSMVSLTSPTTSPANFSEMPGQYIAQSNSDTLESKSMVFSSNNGGDFLCHHSPEKSQELSELKVMMKIVLEQNRELTERVEVLESKLEEVSSAAKNQKENIVVPNEIRHHVKMAFRELSKKKSNPWAFDHGIGPFHEENRATTNYIKNFVTALYSDIKNRDKIINRAIKTYYESQQSQIRKKLRKPNINQEVAKHQRKVHKCNRRHKALENISDEGFLDETLKQNLSLAIVPEMMSSEEEEEDANGNRFFIVHKPLFRTTKFSKLMEIVDDHYDSTCSKRAKEQKLRREEGSPSTRNPPISLKYGYDLFIEKPESATNS